MKPIAASLFFALALLLPPLAPQALSQSPKFSVLYKFSQPDGNDENADGTMPNSGLTLGKDGNLYGLTTGGGDKDDGTAYKITPGGVLTPLQQFGNNNGTGPAGGLFQASDGNFYGVTYAGGTHNQGTIYKLTPSGARTTLYNFAGSAMGDTGRPETRLTQGKDGTFYGVANGDAGYRGAVYQMTPAGVVTILHQFTPIDSINDHPYYSPVIAGSDGNLYGAYTEGYGNHYPGGYLYQVTQGGAFKVLHSYQTSPPTALIEGAPGVFYGILGVDIFKLTASGQYSVVYEGVSAYNYYSFGGGLLLASDGKLYGATDTASPGMIYSVKTDGSDFKVLYQGFTGADGRAPERPLVQGRNGSFYGVTYEGDGDSMYGTIFNLAVFPTITSPTTATATIGQPFSYQITATLMPTHFGVLGLTPGLHVDAKTGIISGTPTAGAGKRTLTLEATNTGGIGSGTLTLTISN